MQTKHPGADSGAVVPVARGTLPQQTLMRAAQARGSADSSDCELLINLFMAERGMRNMLEGILEPMGVTEFKFMTLLCLFALEPHHPSSTDLAFHAGVSRSAMTDILDQMEARGWVRRVRHGEDRRVILVEITEEGRNVCLNAVQAFLGVAGKLGQSVCREQRDVLLQAFPIITKLTNN